MAFRKHTVGTDYIPLLSTPGPCFAAATIINNILLPMKVQYSATFNAIKLNLPSILVTAWLSPT